jgi:Uri superfamily endonuclease
MVSGVYLLVISVKENIELGVGALGSMFFEKGMYAYVGSAQNNVKKRIERHLRWTKKKFWHIDYLLSNEFVRVEEVFYKKTKKIEECRIARKLGKRNIPMKNFGCSDCRCASHLFLLKGSDCLRTLEQLAGPFSQDMIRK